MAFVKIAPLDHLPPGTATHVEMGGNAIAVCNVAGELYAMDGTCPHARGPLGDGALHDHMLVCPWHAWDFDCRTGESQVDSEIRLATYTVKVEEGDIWVDLP